MDKMMPALRSQVESKQLARDTPKGRWSLSRLQGSDAGPEETTGYALQTLRPKPKILSILRALVRPAGRKCRERRADARRFVRPISPYATSTVQLSRSNSESSREVTEEDISVMCGLKKRVSFETEITEVTIEQMTEEDLRNTFYTRQELSVFKDAYRIHRSAPDWKRENDGLPCDCDACQDRVDWQERSRMLFGSPPVSPPRARQAGASGGGMGQDQVAYVNEHEADVDGNMEEESGIDTCMDQPPSPVVSLRGGNHGEDHSCVVGDDDEDAVGRPRDYPWCPSGPQSVWEGGNVSSNVHQAVAQFGEHYAYTTLRLQGFSDHYIRTRLLPTGYVG